MSFTVKGIDHIQLAAPAGCEAEAREFFANIIGMPEIEKPEELKKNGGVWFQAGHHELHIGVEQNFQPAQKAHPAFYIENLKALRERLTNNGIEVKVDDRLPGYNRFYATDPFGNRLEFLEKNN
ncbi:VOC family protein [Salinibacillus xinjiangensis]|uniref:Glyoxalase n=1 Tax=Salinibacillus xinjiangensis TaxID=1229268 RepID=A0A6G1X4G3_9BACI|nr:VOC family protein [Salinibacillus xinjiangensis]MRG85795.1 glyoxalase [Salinibacillus xinjiangensis]